MKFTRSLINKIVFYFKLIVSSSVVFTSNINDIISSSRFSSNFSFGLFHFKLCEWAGLNLIARFPYILSRKGKLEADDRKIFCMIALDFYQNQVRQFSSYIATYLPLYSPSFCSNVISTDHLFTTPQIFPFINTPLIIFIYLCTFIIFVFLCHLLFISIHLFLVIYSWFIL